MGLLDFLESCCDAYENCPPNAFRQAIRMRKAMTRNEQLTYSKTMREAKDK